MSFKRRKPLKAFTVLELSIVLVVIVLIIFITFNGIQTAKARVRDAGRISDLNDLKAVFQLYYMDNGVYPISNEWCSLETPLGNQDCGLFVKNLYDNLEPYTDKIHGDLLYPKTEGLKIYSYQYKTIAFGQEYKIHADLETRKPYEVYSGGGLAIGYEGEGGGGGPGIPPVVLTYTAIQQGWGSAWNFRGEVVSGGTAPGKGIIERGFEWGREYYGAPYPNEWTEPGEFGAGYFDKIQGGFDPEPGGCRFYHYRAKAQDIEGDWGYGDEEKFLVCPIFVLYFDPANYEGVENPIASPINIYVRLSQANVEEEITVKWKIIGGTASPSDYHVSGPYTLRFPSGETQAFFTVDITDDYLVETDETIIFEIYDPSDDAEIDVPSTSTLTIHDNDKKPEVETNPAFPIGSTGATLNGNIKSIGSTNVTERGFEWKLEGSPSWTSWTQTPGPYSVGLYSRAITGLARNTRYYYRAKAKNSLGWSYGLEQTFTTQ